MGPETDEELQGDSDREVIVITDTESESETQLERFTCRCVTEFYEDTLVTTTTYRDNQEVMVTHHREYAYYKIVKNN